MAFIPTPVGLPTSPSPSVYVSPKLNLALDSYRGIYVTDFIFLNPYYAFTDFSNAPYYSALWPIIGKSPSYTKLRPYVVAYQNDLLNWAVDTIKAKNYFNSLTLYTGGLLDIASTNPKVANYQIRLDLDDFISRAKTNYGFVNIGSIEGNELYFAHEYMILQKFSLAAISKTPSLTYYNARLAGGTSIGGSTVSFYNLFDASTTGKFDSIQLEQDWWNYPGTAINPVTVGFDIVTPYNQYDSSKPPLKVSTSNSFNEQMNDITSSVMSGFALKNGWTGVFKPKPIRDVIREAYFARPDTGVGALLPPDVQVDEVVRNNERIILVEASTAPNYRYLDLFNQLTYIATSVSKRFSPGVAQIVILFYCNNTYMYNYFDMFGATGLNNPFHQAYFDLINLYYSDISAGKVSTLIQDNIQFIGYQIYNYADAYNARH